MKANNNIWFSIIALLLLFVAGIGLRLVGASALGAIPEPSDVYLDRQTAVGSAVELATIRDGEGRIVPVKSEERPQA